MPYYKDLNWEGMSFSAQPTGWRSWIPGLRKLSRKWPFFTGYMVRFVITAKPKNNLARDNRVYMRWRIRHSETGAQQISGDISETPLRSPVKDVTRPLHLTDVRRYELELEVKLTRPGGSTDQKKQIIAGFDVKSTDSLLLLVGGVVLSVFLATLGTLGGSYWVGKALQRDEPAKVIIVEPTPTPIQFEPASQSEIDNNAP